MSCCKEFIVDLKKFKLLESTLYLEEIGIVLGQNAKEYSDISYQLIIKDSTNSYVKPLAKAHRAELTTQYSIDKNISYDKCWFATPNYEGVDISDIPLGDYELFLKIIVNGIEKIISLQSGTKINIDNDIFTFKTNNTGNQFKIKRKLEGDIAYCKYSNDKFKIDGCYQDEYDNFIQAPSNLNNVHVQFFGKNNRVILHKNSNLKNTFIEFKGNNATIIIGEKAGIFGNFRLGFGCKIEIGNGTTSTNGVYMTCAESTSITIGNDCMFATNNQIRTDDAHAIYDADTGKRINFSKNIVIGNHVWVAYGATILGGSNIGDGSVIGAYSLLKKSVPNNCIAAGVPAKVIKENIIWERPLLLNAVDENSFLIANGYE
ncbi:acyltransferase [Haemophilus parainfluenzae]|uniref:PcsD n=1 Tax=Haemophilus parainfluenzae TaxID=729 RepID=A0A482EP27_HAEPA|nr:acyltransferase [Haemophilus parainfluenzae]QBM78298.1 PcsD [Haemophilus parainfluenzae]